MTLLASGAHRTGNGVPTGQYARITPRPADAPEYVSVEPAASNGAWRVVVTDRAIPARVFYGPTARGPWTLITVEPAYSVHPDTAGSIERGEERP